MEKVYQNGLMFQFECQYVISNILIVVVYDI